MTIYGVTLLAVCYVCGQLLGEVLGSALGLDANVGGVGFAMLLLILGTDRLRGNVQLTPESGAGIHFWSNMYIPVIVAMSATQNVRLAVSAGWVALLAGVTPVVVCFAVVPLMSRLFRHKEGA